MFAAFVIILSYAGVGVIYSPTQEAFLSLAFIGISALPLLAAAGCASPPRTHAHPPPSFTMFSALFLVGIGNLFIIASKVGSPSGALLSVEGISQIAQLSTQARYESGASSGNPILLALSLFLIYRVGAASCGMGAIGKSLAFAPLLLYALLSTEKWPMFLAISFFVAGLLMGSPQSLAFRKVLLYGMFLIPTGALFGGISLRLRSGNSETFIIDSLLHYIFAPFSAFGAWLNAEGLHCCGYGVRTFAGPLNAIGLAERMPGVFLESVTVHGSETNIYTAYRYLVSDFSVVGPFLLTAMLSFAFLYSEHRNWSAVSVFLHGFAILSALLSLNLTVFTHNSTMLATFLCLSYSAAVSRRLSAG